MRRGRRGGGAPDAFVMTQPNQPVQGEEHAAAMVRALPFPVAVLGEGRDVVTCNPAFRHLFGRRLPVEFIDDAALAQLRSPAEGAAQLYNRSFSAGDLNVVFDVSATPIEAGLLLCFVDRAGTVPLRRRQDRRRRLSALGAVAQGLAEDLLDPVTLIRVNLEQLAEHLHSIRATWDEVRQVFRPRDPQQNERLEQADHDLRDGQEMVGECEAALSRMHRALHALPRLRHDLDESPLTLDVNVVVEEALMLTRGSLRSRCETRATFAPNGRVTARRTDLQQLFINLLLAVGSCMEAWGTLQVVGAPDGPCATITFRIEATRSVEGLHDLVAGLDLSDALEVVHRYEGGLRVHYLETGAAVEVRLPMTV